jgi:hypothetical protein
MIMDLSKVNVYVFPWPKTADEVKEIDIDQFRLLLRGIDFWNEHKKNSLKDLF